MQRVLITRVEDSTYFAELIIDRDGDLISVDARPSDSIAMALRAQARIFADDALLESASQALDIPGSDEPDDEDETQISGEALEEHLRKLRPEDLGRFDH